MTLAGSWSMDLCTLFAGFGVDVPGCAVVDISMDSRTVVRNGLFLACRGTKGHGLDYLPAAIAAGVGAVAWEPVDERPVPRLPPAIACFAVPRLRERLGELANRFFGTPSARLRVTGITGTNGKTTTAWLVAQAITRLGGVAGYLGTLGSGFGTRLSGASLTTPDCISFHRQLRQLADEGATHVIAEASSHALDQGRLDGVQFSSVAFTNLSRDHLDYHGNLEDYGTAKARLFRMGAPAAVINLDDPFGRVLAAGLSPATHLVGTTLEQRPAAGLAGRVTSTGAEGLALTISGGFGTAELHSPLWGRFNAENLLLATGLLLAGGWSLVEAVDALANGTAPPGRMERVAGTPGQPLVLVDYAHSPDAMRKALTAVREHATGAVWCVFGCGGERDRGKRGAMGAVATAIADHVILTDDNPRREDPQQIIADILAGAAALDSLQVVPDRAAAINRAIRSAGPGDVVLIAGKGHEADQIIGDERRPFSDRAVASSVLAAMGPGGSA